MYKVGFDPDMKLYYIVNTQLNKLFTINKNGKNRPVFFGEYETAKQVKDILNSSPVGHS